MSSTLSYVPLQWRPQLAVGVEAIDEDHRQLIDLINQVQAIFAKGGTVGELTLALEALYNYTQRHFAREEAVMKKSGFPELADHVQAHHELIDRLNNLTEKVLLAHSRSATARDLPKAEQQALMRLLRQWLISHVIQKDLRLRDYLSARGQVDAPA